MLLVWSFCLTWCLNWRTSGGSFAFLFLLWATNDGRLSALHSATPGDEQNALLCSYLLSKMGTLGNNAV